MKTSHPLLIATLSMPLLMLAASPNAIAQQHAHAHGRLALNAAVDAQSITIQMEVPLDNFLGFERAPHTDAERKLVANMVARLKAADKLFSPDPRAGCQLSKVDLNSAVLELGEKVQPAPAQGVPAKSGKAPEEHADIDVSIAFNCAQAKQARYIDVKLFDAFKGVQTIDAQVASEQGQFKRTLTRAAPKLSWGK